MVTQIDGPNKIIELDASPTESVRAIYSAWVDWVAEGNERFLPAFPAAGVIGDPPTVPVYVSLDNGWKLRATPGSYTKSVAGGFIATGDGSDPFAPSGGVEPRIVYRDPVIAVGYATGGGGLTPQVEQAVYQARDHARAANVQTKR